MTASSLEAKRLLIQALDEAQQREIAVLRTAAASAREAATHEENKPENDKDTRAIEAGYLAGAQSERLRDLIAGRELLRGLTLRAFDEQSPIALSAVVELDREGERALFFLSPSCGGARALYAGRPIQVVTPKAPIGRALLGKTVGDTATLSVDGRERQYEIVGVE